MNAIQIVANHRQMLMTELGKFLQMYTGNQPEVIRALATKIEHMCLNIGCPSSVLPMLNSIANGKIKVWSTSYDSMGKQLNPRIHRAELERKHCEKKYRSNDPKDKMMVVVEKNFCKGHFRWNYRAYMVDYFTRDYIRAFYLDNNIQDFIKKHKSLDGGFRFPIANAIAEKHNETTYTVEVITPNGNDYRFHYYTDGDRVTSNYGVEAVTETERKFTKKLINEHFKTNF